MNIKNVTAIISFLGGLGWGLFYLLRIFDGNKYLSSGEFLFYPGVMIPTISIVLYVILTKFGNEKLSDLEKMDYEIQILKKQIEQKELKKKLEE